MKTKSYAWKSRDSMWIFYIITGLRDVIYIWRGDNSIQEAMNGGQQEAHGATAARRALPCWLGVDSLAHVTSQRKDASVE